MWWEVGHLTKEGRVDKEEKIKAELINITKVHR